MNKKYFKWWSGLVLFCVCIYVWDIFYASPSRLTVVCAFITNALFISLIWYMQYSYMQYEKIREKLDNLLDEEINNLRERVYTLLQEKNICSNVSAE